MRQLSNPRDVGLRSPRRTGGLVRGGIQDALKGGHLTEIEYFRRSFRLGSAANLPA
jgi:hypothetical protein